METRSYGINLIIKEYAHFPKYLPLPCHTEHGWTILGHALKSDLAANKPLMLVFSKRREVAWRKDSKIPCAIMGAPFVLYKNIHKVKPDKKAKGTVVFPSHSTYDLSPRYSLERFCDDLNGLPTKYKPITICLFWIDYINKAKFYREKGFKVVTAGYKLGNSLSFVNNFYKILSRHKYATGNEVGTSAFYAVDFGLPYFLTGALPKVMNRKNRDVNIGASAVMSEYDIGRQAIDTFNTGPIDKVSQKQKRFVASEIGKNNIVSSAQLNKLLWQSYRKQKYWRILFLWFWLDALRYILIFDMPWSKFLIKMRFFIARK